MVTWISRRFAITLPELSVAFVTVIVRVKFVSACRVGGLKLPAAFGTRIASAFPAQTVPLKSSAVPTIPSVPGSQSGVEPVTKIPDEQIEEFTLQIVDHVA